MPAKRFDPYRLDRSLMKAAAAETTITAKRRTIVQRIHFKGFPS